MTREHRTPPVPYVAGYLQSRGTFFLLDLEHGRIPAVAVASRHRQTIEDITHAWGGRVERAGASWQGLIKGARALDLMAAIYPWMLRACLDPSHPYGERSRGSRSR